VFKLKTLKKITNGYSLLSWSRDPDFHPDFQSREPDFQSLDPDFVTRDPDFQSRDSEIKKTTRLALMGHLRLHSRSKALVEEVYWWNKNAVLLSNQLDLQSTWLLYLSRFFLVSTFYKVYFWVTVPFVKRFALIFSPANFPVLRSTCSRWVTTYVGKPSAMSTNQANSAFRSLRGRLVLSSNQMPSTSVRGGAIWWTLAKQKAVMM